MAASGFVSSGGLAKMSCGRLSGGCGEEHPKNSRNANIRICVYTCICVYAYPGICICVDVYVCMCLCAS